jgi:hypothetical protein
MILTHYLGPNSATGHTSTVMAIENAINYSLRVVKPLLEGKASVVEVRPEKERQYVKDIQAALQNSVWASGCHSWYVKTDEETGRRWNGMSYPWSQSSFWWACLFPRFGDYTYSVSYLSFPSMTPFTLG